MSHRSFVHSISLKRNSFFDLKQNFALVFFIVLKSCATYLLTPIYSRSWHEFAQKMLKIFGAL
ncbi:hypothetical protein VH98_02985 [Acinetobacter brisouii]|nr:hypothetical protein VH98_02985 [Acinetobacter brisouii]